MYTYSTWPNVLCVVKNECNMSGDFRTHHVSVTLFLFYIDALQYDIDIGHERYPQPPVTYYSLCVWTLIPVSCTLRTLLRVSVSRKLDPLWTVPSAPCYLYLCEWTFDLRDLYPQHLLLVSVCEPGFHDLYPQHPVVCICVWERWSSMNCSLSTLLPVYVSVNLDRLWTASPAPCYLYCMWTLIPWTVPSAPCYLYLCF